MSSNEEYLDSLLQSILENEENEENEENKAESEGISEAADFVALNESIDEFPGDDLNDLLMEFNDNLFAVEESEEEFRIEDMELQEIAEELPLEAVEGYDMDEMAIEEIEEIEEDPMQEAVEEYNMDDMAIEEIEEELLLEAVEEYDMDDMAVEEDPMQEAVAEYNMDEIVLAEVEEEPTQEAVEEYDMDEMAVEEVEEESAIHGMDKFTTEESSIDEFAIQEHELDEMSIVEPSDEEIQSHKSMDFVFTAAEETEDSQGVESEYEDDDVAEISGLIADSKEKQEEEDDDMLAFLESMTESENKNEVWETEDEGMKADHVSNNEIREDLLEDDILGAIEEMVPKKEKKGFFAKIFGGKKGKEDSVESDDSLDKLTQERDEEENEGDILFLDEDEMSDIRDADEAPKKQNFVEKIISFLTNADVDDEEQLVDAEGLEPSEENKNILDELEKEDKKKKNKKVKNGKEDSTDDTAKTEKIRKKKEKQQEKAEKKAAKKAQDDEEARRRPIKSISKKNIGIIAAISITIGAVAIMITLVIPSFMDKNKAREAYYSSEYATSYFLLYGKTLDESDTIIFKKSKVIMEMNRKLDSYHTYSSMDKPLEALDALISGVGKYESIAKEAEEYNVSSEVRAIYDTLLRLLNERYGISEVIANEIVLVEDDLTYTRRLKSIALGIPFIDPKQEPVEETQSQPTQDIEDVETDNVELDNPTQTEDGDTGTMIDTGSVEEDSTATQQTEGVQEVIEQVEPADDNKGQQLEGIPQPIKVTINP